MSTEAIKPWFEALGNSIAESLDAVFTPQPAPKVVDCHAMGVCVQSGLRAEQPAQRKPLTDEEWQNIADTLGCFINRGQKDAIEAALGIKENTCT